jgi:cysteine synthase
MEDLLLRPTPLLRWRSSLLKLELLRPSGGVEDRALSLLPALPSGAEAASAASGGAALALAGWARRRAVRLSVALHGALTHEIRAALRLWNAAFEEMPSRAAALRKARDLPGAQLPPLDGSEAAKAFARTLGVELLTDLTGPPARVVAPAGALAALAGALQPVRARWPRATVRGIALVAAGEPLPELPSRSDLPDLLEGIELQTVSREEAAAARSELARSSGVLASHAAAAAALAAGEGGLAIVTSAGEREFSLEQAA